MSEVKDFNLVPSELLIENWLAAEHDLGLAVEMIELLVPALQKVLEFASDRDDPEGGFELIKDLAQTALAEGDRIGQAIIDGIKERVDESQDEV